MDGAQDLTGGRVRTATRLQRATLAIQLAGAVAPHAVLIDERARHSIDFLPLSEFLPGRADIADASCDLVTAVLISGWCRVAISRARSTIAAASQSAAIDGFARSCTRPQTSC